MIINPYAFPPAGGAFVPTDLATLVSWWDVPIPGAVNGARVSPLPDSSLSGLYPLSESNVSERPTYSVGVANGEDATTWTGAQVLRTGGPSASTFPYTFFAVVKWVSGSSAIFAPSDSGGILWIITAGGNLMLLKSQVALIGVSTGAIDTDWHTVMATVDSGNYAFYIDGVLVGSGTHTETLTAGRTIRMGADNSWTGANTYFNGKIPNSGICSSVLSPVDLGRLQTYLRNRFATP